MPTSVRVDEETEVLLERAARLRSETKSELIRMALKQFCSKIVFTKALTPYESIKDLIGCAEGPADLSRRSRHYLKEAFRARNTIRPH